MYTILPTNTYITLVRDLYISTELRIPSQRRTGDK